MDLVSYMSFSDELQKLALDAGTRAHIADRNQQEYLEGGELPSNAAPQNKVAMMGSGNFSPGKSLTQTRAVGNFQDKIIHKGDRLRPPTMGQNFKIPSTPGE